MRRAWLAAAIAACTPAGEVALPGADGEGIGFDDMQWSAAHGVIVPAGRTGRVDLLDPDTLAPRALGRFSTSPTYDGGHDFGATSADDAGAALIVIDRTVQAVYAIDPDTGATIAQAPLAHGPDYVRWVAGAREVWVTEPDAAAIEVFRLDGAALTKVTDVATPGGPESLVIDGAHDRAYTNSFGAETLAIDLAAHAVVATWPNTCDTSSGLAIDPALGLVLSQCTEGKLVALRTDTGRVTGSVWPSDHVDVIAYSPSLRHAYLPSGIDSHVAIVGVSSDGRLATLGAVDGALLGFCATTDDRGRIYVCDPRHGGVLARDDRYAAITE